MATIISARALIGWMDSARAATLLSGQRMGKPDEGHFKTALQARESARAIGRRAAIRPAILPVPAEFGDHFELLKSADQTKNFFRDGFRPVVIDLRPLYAVQQEVVITDSEARVAGVQSGMSDELLELCLPRPRSLKIPAQYNKGAHSWILSSRNRNLKIVGQWGGPAQKDQIVFGFVVSMTQSYLQVVEIEGRYVLADGYHRAYGMLKNGVHMVPAFLKEGGNATDLPRGEDIFPVSMLHEDAALPILTDYFDDTVSRTVELPASRRQILIQGLQYNSFELPDN